MASFSKEYLQKNNIAGNADFSVYEVFNELNEGKRAKLTCDGFGFTEIHHIGNTCYVLKKGRMLEFEEFSGTSTPQNEGSKWLLIIIAFIGVLCFAGILTWKSYSAETGKAYFDVLTVLFSGIALAFLSWSVWMQRRELGLQRHELKLQRKELKSTREEFKIQNETLKVQRFENTFFQMVTLHHAIVDKLVRSEKEITIEKREVFSKAVFSLQKKFILALSSSGEIDYTLDKYSNTLQTEYVQAKNLLEAESQIHAGFSVFYADNRWDQTLDHYIKNLFNIFKYIEQSDLIDIKSKNVYSEMIKAQLTPDELYILTYYSILSNYGNPKFLYLIKRFNIIPNVSTSQIHRFDFHAELFYRLLAKANDHTILDHHDSYIDVSISI